MPPSNPRKDEMDTMKDVVACAISGRSGGTNAITMAGEKEGFIEGKWEDPDKRTIRIYTITPAGQAEVSRITMVVTPKLNETVQVLHELIRELGSGTSENEASAAAPDEMPSSEGPAQAGT